MRSFIHSSISSLTHAFIHSFIQQMHITFLPHLQLQ